MPDGVGGWAELFVLLGITSGIGTGFLVADDDLAWALHVQLECLDGASEPCTTNTEDDFEVAKSQLFNDVDVLPGGELLCRYSGTRVTLGGAAGALHPNPRDGVQVEHTWPSQAKWSHESDKFARDSVRGADLHHLFAVRQGINGSRGNHPFGELPDTARQLSIDSDGSLHQPNEPGSGTPSGSFRDENDAGEVVFEPPADHKGDAARAIFYMSVRYWMPVPTEMEHDLKQWHIDDPPDEAEQERNGRIAQIQGNRNPFVDQPELVSEIRDF